MNTLLCVATALLGITMINNTLPVYTLVFIVSCKVKDIIFLCLLINTVLPIAYYSVWSNLLCSGCAVWSIHIWQPRVGPGHSLSPLSPHFPVFRSFFVGFNYFLLLSIPFLSTRIVSLCFQAGGRRKRPNLGLVCCVSFRVICIP